MSKKENKIVDGYDLNGLKLTVKKDGSLRSGTTAYSGVYFGEAGWQNDHEVYVAYIGLSDEENKISGKKSYMWHLSKHDNVLDAAYAVKVFNENREVNIELLTTTKTSDWDCGKIPTFEYDPIDSPEHAAKRVEVMKKRPVEPITTDERKVAKQRGFFGKKYGPGIFKTLGKTFGRETVVNDIDTLTITEFQLRYGLKF